MSSYERYGEYDLSEAQERREELDKKHTRMLSERRKVVNGEKHYSDDYRLQAMYDLDRGILENRYSYAVTGNQESIASANIEHKKKKVKIGKHGRISRYVKRIENYHTVLRCMERLQYHPSITGELTNIYKDHSDIRTLDEISSLMYRDDKLRHMRPEITEVLKIIDQVTKEFRKSLRQMDMDFNNALYQMKTYIDKKKVSYGTEFEYYKDSLNKLSNKNESIAFSENHVYQEAKDALSTLRTRDKYEAKMDDLSSKAKVDKGIIRQNLTTAELIEFIDLAIEYLNRFNASEPKKNYGVYNFDISEAIKVGRGAVTQLNAIKSRLVTELDRTGFYREVESMDTQIYYGEVTNILAQLYVRLENVSGSQRVVVENEIENVLIQRKIPKDMWDRLKLEARNIADQRRQEKEAEISSKFREMRTKEKREIAIAHRELVTDAEIERFRRDAEIAASSRFPSNYQQKNGDFYDMNEEERAKFIESYVAEQAERLAAMRFDEKEREVRVEEKAFGDYTETMAREGITPEMLELAAEELNRSGLLPEEADLSKMPSYDVKYVVEYAKKLKGYLAYEDDMALAEAMAKDKALPGKEITPEDILIQYNFNNRYNIRGRLRSIFTEGGPKL